MIWGKRWVQAMTLENLGAIYFNEYYFSFNFLLMSLPITY